MNDFLKKSTAVIKKPKTLVIIGLVGIILIAVSSFIPVGSGKTATDTKCQTVDAEQYRLKLEKDVKRIVKGITGDSNCTVVITLESGVRYTYADTSQQDKSSASGQNLEESSSSSEKSYITVKTADGGEKPLLVTEVMPQVRGVAVVCNGGDNKETVEKIKGSVTAALDITSKRVYVAGGKTYEKR